MKKKTQGEENPPTRQSFEADRLEQLHSFCSVLFLVAIVIAFIRQLSPPPCVFFPSPPAILSVFSDMVIAPHWRAQAL
jgi:hypothetical protein